MKRKITIKGFSIVELLVAITISSLLLLGVTKIFIDTKASYNLREGLSRLQENGRFAMDLAQISFRQTGFKANGFQANTAAFLADATNYGPANNNFIAGQVVAGSEGGAAVPIPVPDTLSFRFQQPSAAPFVIECNPNLPAPLPATTPVVANTIHVTANSTLNCIDSAGNDQQIIDGVENMQVLYGVDSDLDRVADMYIPANTVTANGDWPQVVSVRIALLLSTVDSAINIPDTTVYNLLGTPVGPFNDSLRRQVFTTTVAFRNQLP